MKQIHIYNHNTNIITFRRKLFTTILVKEGNWWTASVDNVPGTISATYCFNNLKEAYYFMHRKLRKGKGK